MFPPILPVVKRSTNGKANLKWQSDATFTSAVPARVQGTSNERSMKTYVSGPPGDQQEKVGTMGCHWLDDDVNPLFQPNVIWPEDHHSISDVT